MWHEGYKWHYDYVRLACDTGFCFEKHKFQNFDKTKISFIDIDRVIRERDVATVERCIPTIIQFVLDSEQAELLDGSFVNTFRISQLSVEYLLFCKKYLDNTVVLLKEELFKSKEENKELKAFVEELKSHISTLMAKIKEQNASASVAAFRCDECTKVFSAQEFLNSHKKRRHSIHGTETIGATEVETDKLQLEIKELKGRLNSAEKLIQRDKNVLESNKEEADSNVVQENESKINELQQKFDSLKLQVESELKHLEKQQNFEEKCEKWFGMALQSMKEENLSKNAEKEVKVGNLNQKKEITTQTDSNEEVIEEKAKSEEVLKKDDYVLENAYKEITQFGETLETKVTSSLQKIETQMQSFWSKLNEIETIKNTSISPSSPTLNEATAEKKIVPAIKPRTKYTMKSSPSIVDRRLKDKESRTKVNNFPSPAPKMADVTKYSKISKKTDNQKQSSHVVNVTKPLEVSSSESESIQSVQVQSKPNIKQSRTSVSGKRSVRSLKKATIDEELLNNFRGEVENILLMRLQDLGVSPDWKGLPYRTFHRTVEIVNHQAALMKKTYPDFDTILGQIESDISKVLKDIDINKTTPDKNNISFGKTVKTKIKRSETGKNPVISDRKITTTPQTEIKNRRMYETDSESETGKIAKSKQISLPYSAVIEELKSVTAAKFMDSDNSISDLGSVNHGIKREQESNTKIDQTKGVLKNYPSVGSLTKKKVLFNLQSKNSESEKNKIDNIGKDGGSTTSIASSVLDGTPRKTESKKEKDIEDLSDFDFSEI